MAQKSFEYTDPELPGDILQALSDHCEFDATLWPAIPELIEPDPAGKQLFLLPEHEREILQFLRLNSEDIQQGVTIDERVAELLQTYATCITHSIKPFWTWTYEGRWNKWESKVEVQTGYLQGYGNNLRLVFDRIAHRAEAVTKPTWMEIGYESMHVSDRSWEQIRAWRDANYRVISVRARLNPNTSRGDHYDYDTYDATMHVWRGHITLNGKFSDDFDPTEMAQAGRAYRRAPSRLPNSRPLLLGS